jgi:hypothetical protein
LLGSTPLEKAEIEMYINFIQSSICPITNEIFMNLKGKKKYNEYLVTLALNDLIEQLQCLNDGLKLKTFLVSHHITLCDIFLVCAIFHAYKDTLTEQFRKQIPNVIRLILFVKELPEIVSVLGKAEECKKMAEPLPFNEENKKENKKECKKECKKEDKKECKKEDKKEDKKDNDQKKDKKEDKKEKKEKKDKGKKKEEEKKEEKKEEK